jgi:hypothetical protein
VQALDTFLLALQAPTNRRGRPRKPSEDEITSSVHFLLSGLWYLRAYCTLLGDLQAVPPASREEASVLHEVVCAYRDHRGALWEFLKNLHVTMWDLLSPLQDRIVRLVNCGAPLSRLDAVV